MLNVPTKIRYGVRCTIDLTRYYPNSVSISQIARDLQLSNKYLEQMFSRLKAAKLVCAKKGIKGGYRLCRPPEKILVSEIIEALNGPVSLVSCVLNSKVCKLSNHCSARTLWVKMTDALNHATKGLTLKELAYSELNTSQILSSKKI